MAQAIDVLNVTRRAAGTIAAGRFVTHTGAQAGANANALGVARTDAADGGLVAVTVLGTAVVEAGAAIAVGDALAVDAQGRAVPVDGTTYTVTVARALEAAAAAGEFIEALVIPN